MSKLSTSQIIFLEDAIKAALREIEELEVELEWYVSGVPAKLEMALEIVGEIKGGE
jgi:hypothetical protein